MKTTFILVEPGTPGNVGASARALKTMGFSRLRLVNPCDHLCDQAQMLAHGSVDLLKGAEVFKTIHEALFDVDFVVGTTSKQRLCKGDYYSAQELLPVIEKKSSSISHLAILFGREDRGLINEELRLCHIVSQISMMQSYPSLNLSQSVMLYAYSLSPLTLPKGEGLTGETSVDGAQLKVLHSKVDSLLKKVELDPRSSIYNRILERLGALGDGDIHLLHSICNMLNEKI